MTDGTTEIILEGARILFSDSEDDIWFTRAVNGGMIIETQDEWVELSRPQLLSLREWIDTEVLKCME